MQATVILNEFCEIPDAKPTALAFCEALLEQGHVLTAVIFHHQASVVLGALQADSPAIQVQSWHQLSTAHQFPLLVCAAAAARRGISAEPVAELSFGRFLPVGLATILDAVDRSDRTVTLC